MGWCEGCFHDSDGGTHAEGCRFSASVRCEELLAKQTARIRELEAERDVLLPEVEYHARDGCRDCNATMGALVDRS